MVLALTMATPLPLRNQPLAQHLFCGAEGACDERPAISMKVRDSFPSNFAADFAAAMVEHWPDKLEHTAITR